MEDLYSESDLDMTQVWPPVPPAMGEALAAKPEAGAGGNADGNSPTPSVSTGGPISVLSTAAAVEDASTMTAAPVVTAATSTAAGTFSRLWGDLHGI